MNAARRGLLLGAGAVAITAAFVVHDRNLQRRTGLASLVHDLQRTLLREPYAASDTQAPIRCWGDSLTAGAGSSFGHDYPTLLATIFHRPARNDGMGGETSSQIRARMLARPRDGRPETAIIWAGRNNSTDPATVLADIDAMVESLAPGSRYLVLEIITGDVPPERRGGEGARRIAALNAALAQRHGSHFVPLQQALLDRADRDAPEDRRNLADGIIPASLRSDALHLNDMGAAFVAFAVEAALRAGAPDASSTPTHPVSRGATPTGTAP